MCKVGLKQNSLESLLDEALKDRTSSYVNKKSNFYH